jgi:uncharacterized protein
LERIIQTLKAMLLELHDRYGVTSLGVFGSYMHGEHISDSDLDLLVECDQRSPNLSAECHARTQP